MYTIKYLEVYLYKNNELDHSGHINVLIVNIFATAGLFKCCTKNFKRFMAKTDTLFIQKRS